MKKFFAFLLCLLLLSQTLPALAEEPAFLSLSFPGADSLYDQGIEAYADGWVEAYSSDGGLIFVEIVTLPASEYGMVGEDRFADLPQLLTEGGARDLQELPCEGGVCSWPAQRFRFEYGAAEDALVADLTAIWTESTTFLFCAEIDADAWYGYTDEYAADELPAMVDAWLKGIQITGADPEADIGFEANDYGFFDTYIDTEFFRVGVPDAWDGLYDYEIIPQEPFGYTITFSEKESGFVLSLEARWHDGETVQLASVWQAFVGRLNVTRLGEFDLLAIFSQPAPDAGDAWQTMYEACPEVVGSLLLQEGVSLEEGEYIEYQP